MHLFLKCLFIAAIVATLTETASAIHCYNCSSIDNPHCEDRLNLEDNLKVDCGTVQPPAFLKDLYPQLQLNVLGCYEQNVGLNDNNIISATIRSCSFFPVDKEREEAEEYSACSLHPSVKHWTSECKFCYEDYCNGLKGTRQVKPTA